MTVPAESGLAGFAHDTWVLAGRSLRPLFRIRSLVQEAIGPLVFFAAFYLAFRKLLGNYGVDYAQYLPPAIIAQSMLLVAMSTAFFVTTERRCGLLSRWRSMPISRGAVPAARLVTDGVRAALLVLVIVAAGFVVGFAFRVGVLATVLFFVLAVAFALSLAAGTATIGLAATNPESIMSMLFLPYLPLLALSTAFVPAGAFPGWLQPVVKASPVSAVCDALRALSTGGPTAGPLLSATAWVIGLGLVFGMTAVWAFGRRG